MSNLLITISNTGTVTEGQNIYSEGQTVDENITFTYYDANRETVSMFELSQAEINIFDPAHYIINNPQVAEDIAGEYGNAAVSLGIANANLPNLAPSGWSQIQTGGNSSVTINGSSFSVREYSIAIKDYIETGAIQGRSPSPLFDSEYYLEQNPDVESALAGGSFNGDPLFHYVETGAPEGRDPNPYFDSDYYISANPGVAETNLNPLEHYILIGSSAGADPSTNFDPEFYLAQNQDVAAAGVDPLTHFLTFGQDEGRLPMAAA
ncbi:MAG: hypothetical protein AAGE96_09495 [Cyanobacteria bacterium P01_G01_bin.19]